MQKIYSKFSIAGGHFGGDMSDLMWIGQKSIKMQDVKNYLWIKENKKYVIKFNLYDGIAKWKFDKKYNLESAMKYLERKFYSRKRDY